MKKNRQKPFRHLFSQNMLRDAEKGKKKREGLSRSSKNTQPDHSRAILPTTSTYDKALHTLCVNIQRIIDHDNSHARICNLIDQFERATYRPISAHHRLNQRGNRTCFTKLPPNTQCKAIPFNQWIKAFQATVKRKFERIAIEMVLQQFPPNSKQQHRPLHLEAFRPPGSPKQKGREIRLPLGVNAKDIEAFLMTGIIPETNNPTTMSQ